MPSQVHEMIARMFLLRPELAVNILEVLKFAVPEHDEVIAEPGDLTDVTPTEYWADRVVTFKVAGKPKFAMIIEVQLAADPRKHYSWPAYVGTLYGRLKCPVLLVVACIDRRVAAWCGKPVVITDPGFFTMTPAVLGPQQIPVVTEPELAEHSPELATLSVVVHGDEPGSIPLFKAFLAGLGKVEEDRANLYYDFALASLSDGARALLEELMTTTPYRYQSDFARRYFSAGKVEGQAEGEARGKAEVLLMVLEARGVDVPDDVQVRISGCTDVGQLDTWARRAATADKIGDLFD